MSSNLKFKANFSKVRTVTGDFSYSKNRTDKFSCLQRLKDLSKDTTSKWNAALNSIVNKTSTPKPTAFEVTDSKGRTYVFTPIDDWQEGEKQGYDVQAFVQQTTSETVTYSSNIIHLSLIDAGEIVEENWDQLRLEFNSDVSEVDALAAYWYDALISIDAGSQFYEVLGEVSEVFQANEKLAISDVNAVVDKITNLADDEVQQIKSVIVSSASDGKVTSVGWLSTVSSWISSAAKQSNKVTLDTRSITTIQVIYSVVMETISTILAIFAGFLIGVLRVIVYAITTVVSLLSKLFSSVSDDYCQWDKEHDFLVNLPLVATESGPTCESMGVVPPSQGTDVYSSQFGALTLFIFVPEGVSTTTPCSVNAYLNVSLNPDKWWDYMVRSGASSLYVFPCKGETEIVGNPAPVISYSMLDMPSSYDPSNYSTATILDPRLPNDAYDDIFSLNAVCLDDRLLSRRIQMLLNLQLLYCQLARPAFTSHNLTIALPYRLTSHRYSSYGSVDDLYDDVYHTVFNDDGYCHLPGIDTTSNGVYFVDDETFENLFAYYMYARCLVTLNSGVTLRFNPNPSNATIQEIQDIFSRAKDLFMLTNGQLFGYGTHDFQVSHREDWTSVQRWDGSTWVSVSPDWRIRRYTSPFAFLMNICSGTNVVKTNAVCTPGVSVPNLTSSQLASILIIIGVITTAACFTGLMVNKWLANRRAVKVTQAKERLSDARKAFLSDPENQELATAYVKEYRRFNFRAKLFGWGSYDAANDWVNTPSSGSSGAGAEGLSSLIPGFIDSPSESGSVQPDPQSVRMDEILNTLR